MIKFLEIRRASLFIFVSILFSSIFIVNKDLNNIDKNKKYISDVEFQVEKVDMKNGSIYSKDVLILNNNFENYSVGDIISVRGYIQDIVYEKENTYGLYLKSKGYNYKIYPDKIEKISHKKTFSGFFDLLRQDMKSSIDFLYKDYSPIIRALIIADRQLLSKEETELFSKAGISHIISISGFHIILISAIFYNLFFFLNKKQRYIISSVLTFFYIILIGFTASAVRAYVFYVTYTISIFTNNRYDIFSIGFLLSSLYMIVNPYIIYDHGFCLSFMAVFSIAMFYNLIFFWIKKYIRRKYLEPLISLVSISIASQVLTFPYVYYNFGIVSLISVITNLISVPLTAFVYPFILLSIAFVKFYFIRDIFVNIVNVIMFIFYKSNEILTSFSYSYINFEYKSAEFVITLYVIILFLYNLCVKIKIEKNIIK